MVLGSALAYATDTGQHDADGDFTNDNEFIGEIPTLSGGLTSADFLVKTSLCGLINIFSFGVEKITKEINLNA